MSGEWYHVILKKETKGIHDASGVTCSRHFVLLRLFSKSSQEVSRGRGDVVGW